MRGGCKRKRGFFFLESEGGGRVGRLGEKLSESPSTRETPGSASAFQREVKIPLRGGGAKDGTIIETGEQGGFYEGRCIGGKARLSEWG